MPETNNNKEFRLVEDGHEPIWDAPHVPAVYAHHFGKLTLFEVMEINTAYAFQVIDRSIKTGERLALEAIRQLGIIIYG